MKIFFRVLSLILGLISLPVLAQSGSDQFEGEFFTAKVMNVTVAKQNGNVFVSVLFRGKSFDEELSVSLFRIGEKADDCATLLDSNGGQYVAVNCLPVYAGYGGIQYGWKGEGGLIIRPNVDTIQVFQFRPVERSIFERETTFNLSSEFELKRCIVFNNYCTKYRNGQQSLSFFNLKTQ